MTTDHKRKQDRAITFLTQEEVQNLFSAIKTKRDRAIFAVAYRHGLRASEVGMLQLTDLDLKAGRITINRVKGSMSGTYPMAPDTVKLLKSFIKSRTDASPYLFISNRGLPIDRRTLRYFPRSIWRANSVRHDSLTTAARILERVPSEKLGKALII